MITSRPVLPPLPPVLCDPIGRPLDLFTGARAIGVQVGSSVHPTERDLIRAALHAIVLRLATDDPRVLAWWVALWTAPLSTATIRGLAIAHGLCPRYFEARRLKEGRPTFGDHLRAARILRLQAMRSSGLTTKAVTARAGLSCAKAVRTMMAASGTTITRYVSHEHAVSSYLEIAFRDGVTAWQDWAPFSGRAPLATALLRPAYRTWADTSRGRRTSWEMVRSADDPLSAVTRR